MSTESKWEALSLDEKLHELGFDSNMMAPSRQADMDRRLHAALDQLLDAGGTINAIEELCEPAATGVVGADIPGEMQQTLKTIYELVSDEDDDTPA